MGSCISSLKRYPIQGSDLFKIRCGGTQITLDTVTLDEPGVVIANQLIGLHAPPFISSPIKKLNM